MTGGTPTEETISAPAGKIAYLEERAKKLAREKSYMQLIIRLMNKVSAAQGLESTVEALLAEILDVIGGTNIILYYRNESAYHCADVLGRRDTLLQIDDELVLRVFTTGEALEREHDFSETKMLTPEFSKSYTWLYPLRVQAELIGVLKMENLHLCMRDLYLQLPTFFDFTALVLANKVRGYAELRQAYEQVSEINTELEMEIEERERIEAELVRVRDHLESQVKERTTALSSANERLERELGERIRAEEKLRQLNEQLEQRVLQRTAELEKNNKELERMNRLFVGRELRMVELKQKIRELEQYCAPHGAVEKKGCGHDD